MIQTYWSVKQPYNVLTTPEDSYKCTWYIIVYNESAGQKYEKFRKNNLFPEFRKIYQSVLNKDGSS